MNPKNDWIKTLTAGGAQEDVGAGAPRSKVKNWKQVNPAWPDQPLKLFGPGADSGTFDYFTEAVIGKAKSSRGDYTASEDDNVLVQGVARDVNALGYFGFAYYIENKDKLKAVPIAPPRASRRWSRQWRAVINGTYQPLSRPIFVYINAKSYERPEVQQFVEYYMKHSDTPGARSKVRASARQGLRPQPGACSRRSSSAPSSAAKTRSG